ncbi:MAG: tRNA (adenosine(37)-N6)-threonylcarbamoyltransferase complex ATPase subunit type 1 TsaE [Paludibacteraceae bacterium]|nr:tRNA (adenosine(37)-N6)-threonylcarbamoyltransferase complex ATPase subunit type 1 TsaE [Paludibacteraceae bacterium]
MTIEYKIEEIDDVARRIIPLLGSRLICFDAPMGAGKTTLIKSLCGAMGANPDEVNSPTFSIVNEYPSDEGTIFHFDFYRVKTLREAIDFGLCDYIDSGSWCLMEWPELVADLLPDDCQTIKIEVIDQDTRRITV